MKLFIFTLLLIGAFAQDDVADQGGNEVLDQETIQCESGAYIDGVLTTSESVVMVNCTTRWRENRIDPPRCQTKVEERYTFVASEKSANEGEMEVQTTISVVKECKTQRSCNMNAKNFKDQGMCGPSVTEPSEDETIYFRTCASCCDSTGCNDGLDSLEQVEGYEPEVLP